jgi:hypothetical protein
MIHASEITLYRKTDDKLANSTINFLSATSIHETSFDMKIPIVVVSEIVSPVKPLLHHIEI